MLPIPNPTSLPRRPYKLVCISLYLDDIARLEALVRELKRRGHPRANKSHAVRLALEAVDLAKLVEKTRPDCTAESAENAEAIPAKISNVSAFSAVNSG